MLCNLHVPYHNVSVPVHELDEVLKTPETAFEAAQKEARERVVSTCDKMFKHDNKPKEICIVLH